LHAIALALFVEHEAAAHGHGAGLIRHEAGGAVELLLGVALQGRGTAAKLARSLLLLLLLLVVVIVARTLTVSDCRLAVARFRLLTPLLAVTTTGIAATSASSSAPSTSGSRCGGCSWCHGDRSKNAEGLAGAASVRASSNSIGEAGGARRHSDQRHRSRHLLGTNPGLALHAPTACRAVRVLRLIVPGCKAGATAANAVRLELLIHGLSHRHKAGHHVAVRTLQTQGASICSARSKFHYRPFQL
jgi:hypothetical protein